MKLVKNHIFKDEAVVVIVRDQQVGRAVMVPSLILGLPMFLLCENKASYHK